MKTKVTTIFVMLTLLLGLDGIAHANDRLDDTEMSLKMDSNKDYNDHKRQQFSEEYDRVDEWGERAQQAIMIDNTAPQLQATGNEGAQLFFEKTEAVEDQEVSLDDSF